MFLYIAHTLTSIIFPSIFNKKKVFCCRKLKENYSISFITIFPPLPSISIDIALTRRKAHSRYIELLSAKEGSEVETTSPSSALSAQKKRVLSHGFWHSGE